jgi:hypothetical protein
MLAFGQTSTFSQLTAIDVLVDADGLYAYDDSETTNDNPKRATLTQLLAWLAANDIVLTGDWAFTAAVLELPNSATLPGTCDVGDMYMDSDGTAGQKFYLCESADSWVKQGDGAGGGSAITLDLADDDSNESTDLNEIATSGDTNSIFTEPSADKLLIDASNNWPSADTADALSANGANCAAGEIPLGVDAAGAVEGCYEPTEADISDLDHTATAITDGLIVEADLNEDSGTPTDEDILTYDSTGANFNWIAQSSVSAGTAAALAANGANCAAGEIPLGVDTAGAVEGCYEPTEADISDLDHTATAITDGLIVEADLNEDSGTPTDEDVLTYDVTGANFNWVAQSTLSAGTATALAANGANCAAGEIPLGVDTAGAVEGCYEPTEADISDLDHTATAITDGLIIEPDLNADNAPSDADVLTYDSTGTNFAWITPDAGTDITADLEEEGQINATAVTGNAADDQVILGSGASTAAYATIPDCNSNNMLTYTQSTNTWGCDADDGAGGGAPVGVQYVVGASDATLTAEKILTDGQGIDTVITGGDAGAATIDLAYTDTLAGDPSFGIDECVFSSDGTGGGILCEGTAADGFEGLLVFPVTTSDKTLTLPDATDTLVGRATTDTLTNKTIDATNTVTIEASDISDLSANSDITADLEEEAHCSEHDSADVDCSGETIVYAANSINEDELASSITFASADNIVLPIEAADQTTDGEIDFDTTEEVIEVGDDGVGTLKFYPNAHTTDTGPSPDCSGTSTYQDGEGGCDTVGGDISGGLDVAQVDDVQSATANTEAADNNTTQVATTAFVQQEINGAGGTDLTCSAGVCNVDNPVTAATTANNLAADGLDAMSEIAAGIKRGPDATDTHILTTDVSAPGSAECLEMDTDGSIILAGAACGTGDIAAVGDCTQDDCFTAASPDQTLTFDNATSGTVTLQTVAGALGTVTVSLPAETGTVCTTGSVCSGYDPTGGDDLSDDNPTALQNVTTINDGDYCQGNASSGFDCDVTTIPDADVDNNITIDHSSAGTLDLDQTVAPTAEGRIAWDATNDEMEVGDGTGTQIFKPVNTFLNGNFCTASTGVNKIDCGTSGSLSDDDLSDDNPTALQNVTTINDGDYCQGNASSGFDCDVTTMPVSDGGTGADNSGVVADAEILVYDGVTDNAFESVPLSGDVTISAAGVATVADDSHDHSAAGSTVTINAADIVDLGGDTDITGDLEEETHATEHAGQGLVESADSLNFQYTATLTSNTLGVGECVFSDDSGGGLLCEGTADDAAQGLLAWPVTTSDKTLTLPDATDTLVGRDTTDTLTNKTLTTPTIGDFTNATHDHADAAGGGSTISNKIDRNDVAVNDDDCTGEQGLWWYDTTDSAFEFCNANSGAPSVLGGGTGAFSDAADPVVLNTTTKDVVIGTGQVNTSKLTIDGDADQVQLTVQANSSQADSVVIVENSGGTEVANIDNDGTILTAVGLDAIGNVDMDYGSADVDDHTFTTDGTGDAEFVVPNDSIGSAEIDTIVESMYWPAGSLSSDGTQCADPAEATINSGPKQWTIICTDNDASVMYGQVIMPDSWDAGDLYFELAYVQTAADTSALEWDIYAQCRGATETVNNTWESAVNVIDSGVTGSNAVDHTTNSSAVTCASDAAGDHLFWKIEIDAAGTTTAMATVHFLGVKMEYTSNVGD